LAVAALVEVMAVEADTLSCSSSSWNIAVVAY